MDSESTNPSHKIDELTLQRRTVTRRYGASVRASRLAFQQIRPFGGPSAAPGHQERRRKHSWKSVFQSLNGMGHRENFAPVVRPRERKHTFNSPAVQRCRGSGGFGSPREAAQSRACRHAVTSRGPVRASSRRRHVGVTHSASSWPCRRDVPGTLPRRAFKGTRAAREEPARASASQRPGAVIMLPAKFAIPPVCFTHALIHCGCLARCSDRPVSALP